MNFGEKLKNLRKEIGKSQAQVATEITQRFPDISISQTYLSALEQRANAPREETLEILAQYYDVPITYFFDSIGVQRERKGVESAKEYLRGLRNMTITDNKAFAHTYGRRNENDDVHQDLDDMIRNDDDDEFNHEFSD